MPKTAGFIPGGEHFPEKIVKKFYGKP